MLEKLIKEQNLSCTELEFTTYRDWLTVDTSAYDNLLPTKALFTELYNWNQVENPANWKYYYFLEVGGAVFLQNIVPYVWGLVPITDENVDEVILDHKTKLIKWYADSEKFKLTIEHFSPIIK